ncbi:MAG: hypothetical protein K8J31_09960 [Anaerolineae bacterium]|nr:hypothetical protein [Anaerolineae bacterium]
MIGWKWLTQPPATWALVVRVIVKAALWFVLFNLAFAGFDGIEVLNRVSLYNGLVPGRQRLPYGEDSRAYNLSLNSLDAMFASHVITQPKAADEYRVVLIGDSSVWGILLKPEETLAGVINAAQLTLADGRQVRAYNLGHPILALSKDLLILEHVLREDADLIIWLTTLQSFPRSKQLDAPLVQHNADDLRRLFRAYPLNYDMDDPRLSEPSFLDRTIIGQRRNLADWLRLQLYGAMWGMTGIDQYIPPDGEARTADFEADISWEGYSEPQPLTEDLLAFDMLGTGQQMVGEVPLLLINEPIFMSDGQNSELRYNLWYPRWAYDRYRARYEAAAEANHWRYLDLWDLVDGAEFTDSPVHLTPAGSRQLAERVAAEIRTIANRGP